MTPDVVTKRMLTSIGSGLRRDVMEGLENYLRRHDDLVKTFKMAGDLQRQNPVERVAVLENPHRDGFRVTDRMHLDENPDARRPTGSRFVAAVYLGSRVRYSYDMLFVPRAGRSDNAFSLVHDGSPTLDCMLYPLIHLHAEDPWVEIVQARLRTKRARLNFESETCGSLREYYSARLMSRPQDSEVLFRSKSLFQQWLCEAAVKIENNTLNYAEEHQEELQVCHYDSLKRFVEGEASRVQKQPGRVVLIPPNQQNSERRMYSNYMGPVRISMEFGCPAIMLTFTLNPNCPEVQEGLAARGLGPEEYMHATDLVVRVFLARLGVVLSDIINKGVFGRVLGYAAVHEFTSSMMPHFHLAVILDPADVPETPDEVDALVSAEIPPEDSDPVLHDLVLRFMTHRPCDGSSPGYTNPPCRRQSTECSAGFPSNLQDTTIMRKKGPLLRRRETAKMWHRGYRCLVDNRWIVPYNAVMLRRHVCHMNLMVCGHNLFFKFLYGYFTKESRGQSVQGSMLRYFRSQEGDVLDWDEIAHFKDLRIIGPYEAVYKIFSIPIARLSHSVVTLPIHLPGKSYVYYKGNPADAAARDENPRLTGWFRQNERDASVNGLLYAHIVKSFKWQGGEWVPKQKSNTLGRIMHVNPSPRNMELFYLRLLLLNRAGAQSFADLLEVDGVTHGLFGEACAALGLVVDGGMEYGPAMDEVAAHGAAWQIRSFFAVLIANCGLQNAADLWQKHRIAMSDDFLRRGCSLREALIRARRIILQEVTDIR